MVRLLAKQCDIKSNVELGRFWSQLQVSYMSSHTEELWYNETVCVWMTIYIYIYIERGKEKTSVALRYFGTMHCQNHTLNFTWGCIKLTIPPPPPSWLRWEEKSKAKFTVIFSLEEKYFKRFVVVPLFMGVTVYCHF